MESNVIVAMSSVSAPGGPAPTLDEMLVYVLAVFAGVGLSLRVLKIVLDELGELLFQLRLSLKSFVAKVFGPRPKHGDGAHADAPAPTRIQAPTREVLSGPNVVYLADDYRKNFMGLSDDYSTSMMPFAMKAMKKEGREEAVIPQSVQAGRGRR